MGLQTVRSHRALLSYTWFNALVSPSWNVLFYLWSCVLWVSLTRPWSPRWEGGNTLGPHAGARACRYSRQHELQVDGQSQVLGPDCCDSSGSSGRSCKNGGSIHWPMREEGLCLCQWGDLGCLSIPRAHLYSICMNIKSMVWKPGQKYGAQTENLVSKFLQNTSVLMDMAIKHIRELLESFKELESLVSKTVATLKSKHPQN